jgi:hypothetical protein
MRVALQTWEFEPKVDKYQNMKEIARTFRLVLALTAVSATNLWADVTITEPTGGNNISADKALNSTNGAAFTALGDIVITEGAASDFDVGNYQTLILTAPPGWQFKPGVGTVSYTALRNITAATISVTASDLTVTFSVNGTDKLDVLTISGLQVQPLDGADLAASDYIRCLFDNPGTAVIPGIDQDYTTFGLLNEVAGAAKALAMQTQPGATATAGALFSPQPAVAVVDQFGNLRDLDNTTVVSATRAAGSGTLQGTLQNTAVFGVATYNDLSMNVAGTMTIQFSATNLVGVTSAPVVVAPAPADHLVFATQPGSASAGVPFGVQPVIKTQDRFGSDSAAGLPASQLVTVTLSSGNGTLSGTTTLDIGTAAGNGLINFTNLQIDSVGTGKQLTASSSGLGSAVSASFAVGAGMYSKLQLLLPGEIAAPGTVSGKTGTPNPQAAGTPFNVTVNAVDANWNLVNTVVDTVGITSTDTHAGLPANAALVAGTKSFSVTLNTAGSATLTATDLTDSTKSSSTSPSVTVGGGTPKQLALLSPPSATATAGIPFAQQPVIAVQDAGGNLVATDNGRVISVARSSGSASLQGTLTATTVNGLATFTNLSYNLAETITLNFTATGLTNVPSGNIAIGAGPFSKVQLLVPGETAAPGTGTGKTGTPSAQTAGASFPVTVNAVDAQWNLANSVSDSVGLTSSDSTATLPPSTALAAGTTNLAVSFNSTGNFTLTASDLTDGTKTNNTSPSIAVSPAQFTAATGGSAISADGAATNTFTSLTGPNYSENASGNVGTGTVILNAPAGFVFDTGGTAPTMLVTRLTGSGGSAANINGVASGTAVAMTSVTSTQLTFTVTSASTSGVTCKLTWQNVRVRPGAGTPLAVGNLIRTGTAAVTGVSPASNLGTLREVAGAASNLVVQNQPSASAIAGVAFAQQPVLQVRDQFGNLRSAANGVSDSTVVAAARGAGSGTLQGTLNATATNGIASFTNLSHTVATNITLAFSASGVTGTNSGLIAISPAAADHLVFTTQPGSTTYGLALSPQPVLQSQDPFGNNSTVGLGTSQMVSLTLGTGTGTLQGTTVLDIGTAAGNGAVVYSGLAIDTAGSGKQLSASSTGLTSALSSAFAISQLTVTGNVTINSKVYDGTTAATIATRALTGALPGDNVSLSGGTASFATKSVGSAKSVTATSLTLSGTSAANYQLASTSATATADITARPLSVSATATNKIYDGTTSVGVALSDNRVAGDSLTSSFTSASFADKNVGTAKPVSVSGVSITGADATNYTANTTASATANITVRSLTVSATATNKVYDGTTAASVALSDNRLTGDSLTVSSTSASFADKNVGTAKSVSVSGISVTGADSGNYTFNSTANTTANITAKGLTVSGITAANKVYDATTTATLGTAGATLVGAVSGDSVSLNAAGATGAFADKNVGTSKTATVSGLSLGGTDAANYTLSQPTTTATITLAGLTITANNQSRTAGQPNPSLTASYSGFVGGETLATSGVTGSPALSTATTDVAGTYPITAVQGTLSASNYSFNFVNGLLTVTPASASTLVILTQPSSTASAGVAFAQQPAIAIQDAYGNLRTTDNSTVITAARNAGSGTLQGALSATAVNGVVTFVNLSHNLANTINLGFSSSGLTSATSANIIVSPAAFTQLQLLVPGESAAPGTGTGKTGTPSSQLAAISFPVTVNAVDNFWNVVNSVSDAVALSASDATATLPAATALAAGTTNLTVAFNANGSFTLTATDLTDGSKGLGTSPVITVGQAQYTPTTAGGAISADTSGGTWTTLTGLTYTENNPGEVGLGTIVLNAPSGFLFDTGGTAPSVSSVKVSGGGNNPVQGSVTAVTSTQIVYTVTTTSANPSLLTWQNVRVRPTAGSPLASGSLTRSGTASVVGLPVGVNLGALREVPGAASGLAMLAQPSVTATAGARFAEQPVIRLQDQFGNSCANNSSTVVSVARGAGSGTLQGTLTATVANGIATFTNLSHNVATNITLAFSASGVSGINSGTIAVSPAAADRLMFAIQPGSATYGSALGSQPMLKTRDPFGNDSTVGLGAGKIVSLTLGSGSGSLLGTSSLDIGTAAGNGTVAFSGLTVSSAGTNKQLSASAPGLTSALSSSFAIGQATVAGSVTANNKIYDGTTAATLATRALTGAVSGDDVSLSGGTATFASKTVGSAKTVTVTGLSLVGTSAANYLLASNTATAQADITTRSLNVTATGSNKVYDATASATVTLSDNRVAGDSLTSSYASASFADKNVGTAKAVSVSGISISGADAPNYTANTTASATANITTASVTAQVSVSNKVYDGTTAANISSNSLQGVVGSDNVSLSGGTASFASKTVGTNKTVSVAGLGLSGSDAGNYQLGSSSASATANITARSLTVSATGVNKVYDATSGATITLSDNRVSGDSLSANYTSASFVDKNVGTAKTVSVSGISISGTDAANYTANSTASTTANITARSLSVTAGGNNKAYDGTTAATVTLSDNRLAGDSLATGYTSASFVDKNVGTAKTVSVSGISISGTDAANYTANSTASTTANITARSLSVTATSSSKVYDGTPAATVTLSDNRLAGDSLSSSYTSASFSDKNVGTAKTVSVSGISVTGTDSANYSANSTASTTANITPRSLTVIATGANKVYDGTTASTATLSDNRVAGDNLTSTYTSASFADKNVGTAKTVSVSVISVTGTDSANYSANSTASTTANITARSLTVSAMGVNKAYDGTTTATVTLSDNRVAGDSLSTSYSSAGFSDKNVGTAKSVSVSGISVSGTDSTNYSANTATSTTANVTAKGLAVSGITAADKVYDATTSAILNTTGATLSGVISGDTVTLNSAGVSGAFADKNVGTAKTVNVSALSLGGADAANYTLTQPTTTASITKAALAVSADNKSRTAGQANPTLTASYSGFVGGETLATSGVTGSPALSTTTTNLAGTYPITAAQGTLSASNYSFISFANGVLTVTPASASSLVILTQPSSTATAGVAFAQQPAVAIQDGYGNLRTSDNSTVITAARNAGSGTLQGALSATAVNGVATFVNLSHNVANSINLTFSSTGLTNTTSANILVSPTAFAQLQLLVPGESAAPGTANGKTGTPSAQTVTTSFPVTVNAVDSFWNLVNTVSDTVALSASDTTATLPTATALAGGTTNLMVCLNATGNFTLTANDLADGTKAPSTSPVIAVSAAQFTQATGGGDISADRASGTFKSLSGPTYSEKASGDAGIGTIVLNAPAGFVFDTGGTAPTVLVTRLLGSGTWANNINDVSSGTAVPMTSVTSTQLAFTVTSASASGVACKLTWQNVRVRPTAGTPLAIGNLTCSGTASVVGLSTNANLATLVEIPGAASSLVILTQPSSTATAGAPFAQQPVIRLQDQFGNFCTNNSSTVVSVARNAGSGTLQGTLTATPVNGIATFTNLSHNVATNITLAFSALGATGTNSSLIALSPAAADHLVFTTQPGSTTYGSSLSSQPVLQTQDPFGNNSTVGLGTSQMVSLSLSAGSGPLLGTSSLDIGTAAGNGTVAFAGLAVSSAGTNKQLSASAPGLTSAQSSTFAVSQFTVPGSITANSKVYDGTTAATIATRSLSGVLAGDDVSLSGGTATFGSKTAGTAKTVTATGLGLSGASAANYQLASTSASATADITARPLSVSATGNNKVYDGTTSATVSLSDNRVAGDSLTASCASASFADKSVGSTKAISVSGIAINGADAPNYTANTTAGTTANITVRTLTVGASATNKVYDATASATVTLSDNRVAGDSLSAAYVSAGFADKNVGTAKTVSVSGISVSGTDSPNYIFNSSASTTASITARALLVSATGVGRVYDGTTTATVTFADNRLAGDSLSATCTSASFTSKNVGTGKSVNVSGIAISGADAGNYSANSTTSAAADITARALTVSATGVSKIYDATTSATVTLADNRVSGDSLSTAYTSASFADKNVGSAKTISVSGIAISGTDAANYSANTTASATANITTTTLTALVSASNKVYDGSATATISSNSLQGVLGSDNVSLSGGSATFANKNVGTAKTVSVTGLSLTGSDAANYQLGSTSASTTANITTRPLTVSAAGVSKVYNGNTSATATLADNRVSGDNLNSSYSSASFSDKNVGAAKPVSVSGISISGPDSANYSANTTANTTADITVRSLTVSATGNNKVYDTTATATVSLSDNRVAGDSLSTSYSSASFADKYVGTAKSVSVSGITVTGTDSGNYTFNSSASTTANITAKGLTVSGITAADKVYDATTAATLNTTGATLSGVLSGDTVTLNSATATGAFADKNVGTAKTVNVSALSLGGADAANYTLTQPTTTASITKAALAVSADNKSRTAGQANPTLTASYSGFVGGETLATSGVTGSPALSTTTTNLAGTYPITAAQGTLSASNYSFISFANGVLTVTPASASSLVILTQPSSSATAGVIFAQQPAIAVKDAYGNLRSTDNSTVVSAARNAGSGTLQGTLSVTAVNGVATFANLSHKVANTISLTFSSSGTTNATSANIVVGPAAFAQLQLLAPGESPAPGTSTGKTGTPGGQLAGVGFTVAVNAVDSFWNVVNTVSDTVALSTSDTTATLPAATALAAGTTNLTVVFNATGNFTLTANDLTDASKPSSTSPAIAVSAAQFTPATGGAAISADGATGTFTTLTGPTYSENNPGEVGTGTIILNAPTGFIFDTGGVAPTVTSVKISGSGNSPVLGSVTSVTSTQIVYTVTATSANPSLLTWQNVRVRPTAGTPLVSGSLTRSGTASVVAMPTGANLGALREVPGAVSSLVILTQPSTAAIAGAPFAQQPVICLYDQFGNFCTNSSTAVTASRTSGTGSGALQGTTSLGPVAGIVTFTNLSHNVATNITIDFSAAGATTVTSTTIAITPAALSRLGFATQPGGATAGSVFSTQPVLATQDQFGNNTAAGLPASLNVSLSLSSGTGPLQGTATLDIGTAAGNGMVAFSGLEIDAAGTNKQLTASAPGLTNSLSSTFTINPGPSANLVLQTQPPALATAGATFSPAPVIRLQDAFGNLATTDNSTVVTASRNAGTATLQGTTTVTAVNGLVTFANLSYNKAETITLNFSSSLGSVTSASVTVVSAAPRQLVIQAQPSAAATAGVAFAQQPVIYVLDAQGNLVNTNGLVVTAARSTGTGTLQGSLSASTIGGVATFTNLSYNVAETMTVGFTSGSLTNATSSNVLVSHAAFAKLQLLVPGESAAPGSASGKTGTPAARTAGTAFNVSVNAVDAFWNLVNTVTDTMGVSSSDTNATLPSNVALIAGTNVSSVILVTGPSQTLTVTDITDSSKTNNTSSAITVNAGTASKLVITQQPSSAATAGAAFPIQPKVTVLDAYGNTVTSYATAISATETTGGSLNATNTARTATPSSGVATFSGLFVTNAASGVTLTFTSGSLTPAASSGINVSSASASRLAVNQQPSSSATAGIAFATQPQVTVQDAYGNTALSYAGSITAAQTSGGNLNATTTPQTASASSGIASFSGLYATNAGTITLTFTGSGLSSATSTAINMSAGPVSKLAFTSSPVTATAGSASSTITVQRRDAFGNPSTAEAARAIVLSSTSGGSASFNPSSPSIASGSSSASFTYTDTQAGSPTITAASTSPSAITSATQQETVNAAAASSLAFVQGPPASVTVNQVLAPAVTVLVSDAYGNPKSGTSVTMSLNGGGTLSGGGSQTTAANGIATFSSLSVNQAGTGKSLTANVSSPALSVTSSTFTVLGAGSLTTVGTQNDATGAATLAQSATVTTGNTIFVTLAMDPTSSAVTVTDSANNTYRKDADVTNSAHAGVRTLVFSAPVTNALSGGTITIHFPSATPMQKAATFLYMNNLVSPVAADKTSLSTGTNASPNSGTTATTSQPDELLLGAIGVDDKGQVVTATGTLTNLTSSFTSGGSQGVLIQPAYRRVNATGQFVNSASLNANKNLDWADALVTYRIQAPAVTAIALAGPATNRAVSVSFTVTFSENVFNVDASDFALAVTGLSGASITSVTGSGTNYTVTAATGTGNGTLGLNLVDNDSIVDLNNAPLGGTGAGNGNFTGPVYTINRTTTTVAANASATYGDATVTLNATVTATVAPNPTNGNVTFYLDGTSVGVAALAAGGTASLNYNPQSLAAGNHTVRADFAGDGTLAASSSDPSHDGTLSINQKPLLVTAANAGKTYGQTASLAGTGFISSGLVNGDTLSSVTLTSVGATPTATVSGSPYPIVPSAAIGTGLANYSITYVNGSLSVNPLAVTLTGTRTYNGTGAAAAAILTVANRAGGDNVTVASGTGTLSSANVGSQAITSPGTLTLGGTAAANYTLTGASGSVTVTPATLTVTADNKSCAAGQANPGLTASYSGFVGGETLATSGVTGTPALSTTSTNIPGTYPITVTQGTLSASNYSFSFVNGVMTVTPASASSLVILTQPSTNAIAGVPFDQQPVIALQDAYGNLCAADNSTIVTAARNDGSGTLQGTLTAMVVNGLATFTNLSHNVATNITLAFSASGMTGTNSTMIAVSPAAADHLVFTTQPGSTTYGLALNPQPVLQTQDPFGNNSTVGLDASLMVSLSLNTGTGTLLGTTALDIGTNAGNGTVAFSDLTVSLAGTNNQLSASATGLSNALSSTFDVAKATVTASITANNKTYDGTTDATIASGALSGVVAGDDVSLSGGTAAFDSKSAGTAKTVTTSGLSLSGSSADNYLLASTSATALADIAPRPLTVSATGSNKVYDGNTSATVSLSDNRLAGDNLSATYTSATFADKNAGTAKGIAVSGIAISGADAANYTPNTTAVATADITVRTLTVSAAGLSKVYDGSAIASVTLADDRLASDNLATTYASASFTDKNVGVAKPVSVSGVAISGPDAPNYTGNTTASAIADITVRTLTVSASATNKVYDATTTAAVTLADDRLAGDSLSTGYASASFSDKNAGTAKQVSVSGITVTGTDSGNYTFNTSATTIADLTAKPLTVSGIAAVDKPYDATTTATLNTAAATLSGMLSGDTVTLDNASATGVFADKNAGAEKDVLVTGLSLSGTDAANYTLTQPATTASITKAGLTVTADNKNCTAGQAAPALTASYSGFVGGETLDTSGVTGTPALSTTSTNVAGTYPITVAQGTLSASNYSFTFVNGVLTVTPASASLLVILTQPSSTASVGVPFVRQPVIALQDAYGNLCAADNSTVITVARNAGSGTLQGSLSVTVVNGVATFVGLSHDVADTINLSFSSSSLANATSDNILVSPAQIAAITGIRPMKNGFKISFSAAAGCTCQVARTSALQGGETVWTNIGSATADASGHGEFTDTNPPTPQGYYRVCP